MGCVKQIICCVALLGSLSGFALTETVDGITWTYTVSNGEARLGNDSSSIAVPTSTSGAIVVPSKLGGYNVRAIGAYAFRGCSRLTSVTVPSSVTSIADSAFNGCSGLTEITVPFVGLQRGNSRKREALFGYIFGNSYYDGGIKMKQYCTETSSGSSFYIPSSLRRVIVTDETLLGYGAFSGLSGLTSITVGDRVTSINSEVFSGCSGLTSVTIGKGVTYIASSAFSGCSGLRNVAVPQYICSSSLSSVFPSVYQSIANVVILAGVTSIGASAFSGGSGLTSVTIPDSVTSIGASAFSGCRDSLFDTTTIPGVKLLDGWLVDKCNEPYGDLNIVGVRGIGASVFSDCTNLTSVTISNGVTRIGASAFYNCNGLTNVTILGSVTNIGSSAFSGCTNLTSVCIDDVAAWCRMSIGSSSANPLYYAHNLYVNGVLATDLTIPDGVTSIGTYAFYGCSGLTSVTIPDGVTDIGGSAFNGCSGLKNVVIGSGVTSIGSFAFEGCSDLTNVYIDDVAAWCRVAFGSSSANPLYYAHNLYVNGVLATDLTIPDGVTSIGNYAFYGYSGLTSVTIPNSVTNIGSYAFYNCNGLTSVTIPNSVMEIGSSVFSGCSGLTAFDVGINNTSYKVADGLLLTKDGRVLVAAPGGLTNVTVPEGVTSIGDYAFYNCSGLTSVVIPDSVTSIGDSAFYNCNGLTSVCIDDVAAWCRISFGGSYANPLCYAHNLYVNGVLVADLTIPDSVTSIGAYAFCNCSSLTSMTIPNSVTEIGSLAFSGCSGLTSMTMPECICASNTLVSMFSSTLPPITDVTIADGVTTIGEGAFGISRYRPRLSHLTSITIPNSVTDIATNAFSYCDKLTSVTIPRCVCTNRLSVVFPASYQSITNVIIADGVELVLSSRLLSRLLSGCGNITSLMIPAGVTISGLTVPCVWNGIAIDYIRREVTLDLNDGTGVSTTSNIVSSTVLEVLPTPIRENAFFLGWFTDAEGGDEVVVPLTVTAPIALYAHWLAVEAPVVEVSEGNPFRTDTCEVWIACATDGATIYYTDDGSTPKVREEYLYTGPFTITDTATIKAVAVYGGIKSKYTTLTIEKKPLTLEEALGCGDGVTVETSESAPWMPVVLNGQDACSSSDVFVARSGAIGDRANTWLTATVEGAGTMSFWCKTSCEHDEDGVFSWDRLMVYTNGMEIIGWRMDGETDWTERTLSFVGGTNTVKWVYAKDRTGTDGEDCAWLDAVMWTPSGAAAWLAERGLAADTRAANGRTAAECYAVGLDPAVATNDFRIVSIEMVDGKPQVEWEPKTNRWTGAELEVKVKGAESLEGPWGEVPTGGNPTYRFFKVEVVVP